MMNDTASMRALCPPGCEIETYKAPPGSAVLYRSLPVLKMTRNDIEYRKLEARAMHAHHVQAMLNDPVYRARVEWSKLHHVETATGAALDALCGIPIRPPGTTDAAVRAEALASLRSPDFRDGRCMHGEGLYSCPICAVQDGRV